MDQDTRIKIEDFLRKQINNADIVANSYIRNENNTPLLMRNIFVTLYSYVDYFLKGDKVSRWVVLTGLRGVGKTTAMMNLYSKIPKYDKLYLSVDRITELFGVSFFDVLSVYEEMIGGSFENLQQPLFLFIDEAQYDKKWAYVLKDVYDRAHNVFILTTGSSALDFNMNVDTVRRPIFEKMLPLTFTEYIKLKNNVVEQKGLSKKIREAILYSQSAEEVFNKLKSLELEIKNYLTKFLPIEFKNYITTGSLPALLFLPKEVQKFERITQSLKRIVSDDIARLYGFDADTIRKVPTMLYNISQADKVSYGAFSKMPIEMNRHTAKDVIDALIKAEVLLRIPAYTGSHASQVKQPSKYAFLASSFRASFFQLTESINNQEDIIGSLLEDVVALYLYKYITKNDQNFIAYDAENGGADFVVGMGDRKVVIEVGAGQKDYRQVEQTAKKVNSNYSLIIANNQLELSKEKNAVKIPKEYFFLM